MREKTFTIFNREFRQFTLIDTMRFRQRTGQPVQIIITLENENGERIDIVCNSEEMAIIDRRREQCSDPLTFTLSLDP